MEYIEGRNLKSLLGDKKKFTWDEIADLIAQIGEALDYAHRKGIIHRDIKPANIIMTTDGKIKITDFGIAKIASSNLTTTGQFLGTPNYMSPEQVSGAPVDGRSDIFSLGVVLYELLTNRKPFLGDNLTAISYKIVHEDFTPPAELSTDVPPEFNSIVARAMAKDPWNRYQRGKDLALALYQLKAHLEEQKALEDLGTMVSAAENLPTLKLSNLQELAAMGAPNDSEVMPPRSLAPPRPAPAPAAASRVTSDEEMTRAAGSLAEAMSASDSAPGKRVEETDPSMPTRSDHSTLPAVVPAEASESQEWKKLAKAEVNPRWFWIVSAAALGLLVVIVGWFALRAKSDSRPSVERDAAMEQEVHERKQALEDGKRLFTAGHYEESLGKFRQVLARSPNNQEARQYAQMAENAVAGRQKEQQKVQQAGQLVEAARAALAAGRNDEAKAKAEEVLAIDASNADGLAVRDEADKNLAESKAADAAKKKIARGKEQQLAKKNAVAPSPAPAAGRAAAVPPPQGPAPAPVPGNASLRLAFESPIPEGHIMVAVNDQILLRKPFSFKKNESRVVTASLTVASGNVAVKAWFSGPNMPSVFGTASAQLNGGDAKTLLVNYSGGALTVRVQ